MVGKGREAWEVFVLHAAESCWSFPPLTFPLVTSRIGHIHFLLESNVSIHLFVFYNYRAFLLTFSFLFPFQYIRGAITL